MTGYVYAIECVDRIKLGFSANPKRRLTKIATDSPYPCTLLGCWRGTKADEIALHARFAEHRIHREWFIGAPELRTFITERTKADAEPLKKPTSLKEWFTQQGSKRYLFAEKVGCSPARISQICDGETPSFSLARRIVQETGGKVSFDDLLQSNATPTEQRERA